jgi:DNA-binding NtrC family response regulator
MKTLLIVDDEENYRFSLEFALKKQYQTRLAKNMEEAIAILKEGKPEIDIALIDIRLDSEDDTNIDGIRILEWITLNKKEINVFMMSSYKVFDYGVKSLNLGARHFFEKPIDIISLKTILKEKGEPDGA